MSADLDVITQELAALMRAHNRWTARVRRLQRVAAALEDPMPPELEHLQAELGGLQAALLQAQADLQAAQGEREQLRAQSADWEQKARVLAQYIDRERRAKESQPKP